MTTKTLATLLISTYAVLNPLSGASQILIPLEQGMSYEEARQQLLSAGWQTKGTRWQDKNCPEYLNGCKYPEVEACAGTGSGPCKFKWLNISGKTLSVYTESDRNDNMTVSNWALQQ